MENNSAGTDNSRREDADYSSISVLVPCYNEEASLHEMHKQLSAVLDELPYDSEIIYVNDGSTDSTLSILQGFHDSNARVALLDLSRNYGKEIAMSAGIDHADGDAVIIIDADLQHPPKLIPEMIKYWLEGYDVVYAVRISRKDESLIKKTMANIFYNMMKRISHVSIPEHSGDFRLLSRRAADSIRAFREQHRFMKGLYAWVGYPQKAVPYQPDMRFAGKTKWNFWHLWNFAIEGVTSFSTLPLKVATYLGFLSAAAAFCYGLFILVNTLLYGNPVKGFPSVIVVILFLGGIQMMFIGIIGEYIGRMFDETKNRPLYFINRHLPSDIPRKITDN